MGERAQGVADPDVLSLPKSLSPEPISSYLMLVSLVAFPSWVRSEDDVEEDEDEEDNEENEPPLQGGRTERETAETKRLARKR